MRIWNRANGLQTSITYRYLIDMVILYENSMYSDITIQSRFDSDIVVLVIIQILTDAVTPEGICFVIRYDCTLNEITSNI